MALMLFYPPLRWEVTRPPSVKALRPFRTARLCVAVMASPQRSINVPRPTGSASRA